MYRPFWALSSASVGNSTLTIDTNSGYNRDQGVTAQILAFTLTILNLTRNNYQQIRLFVDSDLLFSILCFQPVGNTFLKRTIQPSPVLVFPCLTALNNQQTSHFFFTELTFSTTEKQRQFLSLNRQLTYLSSLPPAPIATHILAHPVAKYLFIQVCPKFAISHCAVIMLF